MEQRIQAEDFEKIDPASEQLLIEAMKKPPFPAFLGLQQEEVRKGYSRMRLPYRPEFIQPMGILHGGAILSLIDTCVVTAIMSHYGKEPKRMVTLDIYNQFLSPVIKKDAIAESCVSKAGGNIVYLKCQVHTGGKRLAAEAMLTYMVSFAKT